MSGRTTKLESVIYDHDAVVEAIREHAERRGIEVERVGWYYDMSDRLKYEVIRKEPTP